MKDFEGGERWSQAPSWRRASPLTTSESARMQLASPFPFPALRLAAIQILHSSTRGLGLALSPFCLSLFAHSLSLTHSLTHSLSLSYKSVCPVSLLEAWQNSEIEELRGRAACRAGASPGWRIHKQASQGWHASAKPKPVH